MFKKITHFIKYNNITVFIILAVFILGSGVFAQTDAGQAMIGEKQANVSGVDNTLLLDADLENFDMDYNIERILEDEDYYYVTYTYLDLIKKDSAWEYQIQEQTRKVTRKLKEDLGKYLAEELGEEYDARVKDLKAEQALARETGEEARVEVTEYTGLIGQTLAVAGRIFPGYEPVKVRELPAPTIPPTVLMARDNGAEESGTASAPDDLTEIYNDYILANDPDQDNIFGSIDNCPYTYNPDQLDSDEDGIGDACDTVADEVPENTATPTEETMPKDPQEEPTAEEEPGVEIIEIPAEEETVEETPAEEPAEEEAPVEEEALAEEPAE